MTSSQDWGDVDVDEVEHGPAELRMFLERKKAWGENISKMHLGRGGGYGGLGGSCCMCFSARRI